MPPKFNFIFFQFDWPITQINETMEATQHWRFYFEIYSSSPLAHLYGWKEGNICQRIWDKFEVLLGTLWGTGQKLENSGGGICEKLGSSLGEQVRNLGTLCFEAARAPLPAPQTKSLHVKSTVRVESEQLTLHTKHNLKKKNQSQKEKKGGPFTPWLDFALVAWKFYS